MTTWTVKKSDALLPGAWGVRSRVKGLDHRMFGVVMVGTGFILGPGCNKCQLQDLVPPVECHMRLRFLFCMLVLKNLVCPTRPLKGAVCFYNDS